MVETRSLKMHEKLLFDVIKRQAGTLDKAILEGVMNAIEAGASKVDIDIKEDADVVLMSIYDDGNGIGTVEEIEKFFETFGQPHEASENKTWAQFRMGRGQLFSFGKNTWRTGTFEMVVDILNDGLEYQLKQNLEQVEGCRIDIELYNNPFGTWRGYNSVKSLKDRVKEQIEFMQVPTFFNGEQVNTPPQECKWDSEDNDAYYSWGVGSNLTIYNLGALVKSIPANTAGTIGVIVSKKQLKVNFARNDIQYDCEVWQRIQELIKQNRIKKTRKTSRRLYGHEKIAALKDIRDGIQEWDDMKNIGLVETSNGKMLTLDYIRKNRQQWTFVDRGNRFADKLLQSKQAVCLCNETMTVLSYSGDPCDFFVWLTGDDRKFNPIARLYCDFEDLTANLSDKFVILSHDDLTVSERRIIKVLEEYGCWAGRQICIGLSDRAVAWTDGRQYIVMERNWLKSMYMNSYRDCALVIATLIHELAHDEDTTESHIHGEAFYSHFHDICFREADGYRGMTPLSAIGSFYADMKRSKIDEQREKEVTKAVKAQAKRDKKIGVDAARAKISAKTETVKDVLDQARSKLAERK
jgi:hypothetical protein